MPNTYNGSVDIVIPKSGIRIISNLIATYIEKT